MKTASIRVAMVAFDSFDRLLAAAERADASRPGVPLAVSPPRAIETERAVPRGSVPLGVAIVGRHRTMR